MEGEFGDAVREALGEDGKGRLSEKLMAAAYRTVLHHREYRNQGWILDGYPKTRDDVLSLFEATAPPAEDGEEGDAAEPEGAEAEGAKQKCGPDVVVVSIAAEEEMLKSRVGAIGEAEAE